MTRRTRPPVARLSAVRPLTRALKRELPRAVASLITPLTLCAVLWGQVSAHPPHLTREGLRAQDPFRQLEELWPTPTEARLASGLPGPAYWQQRADYKIDVRLDDEAQRVEGEATITYHNQSPHELAYLWLQLDQNRFRHDSLSTRSKTFKSVQDLAYEDLRARLSLEGKLPEVAGREGGHQVAWVRDAQGQALPHTIVDTMMRLDLPTPLASGERVTFSIAWSYQLQEVKKVWSRGGFETLKPAQERDRLIEEGLAKLRGEELKDQKQGEQGEQDEQSETAVNDASKASSPPARRLYEVAQWFPRLAAYTDVNGWQNKPFLGNGEFTLEFGDYEVNITVPNTFTVAATGELQNPQEVLSEAQRARLKEAASAPRPVMITTAEEAKARELVSPTGERVWRFKAENVRDFAFAASSTFLWDAWGYPTQKDNGDAHTVMAMSFYPLEAEPLWSKYSTHAVVHTLEVYERFAFTYPYPTAISVNGPVGGMEYPMICFNGPRPDPDGTYSKWSKYGLISVVIHEVGHFFFPMIVNSDERQWTWMDEGINTFLEYQAERAWEPNYPAWRGEPEQIVGYMSSKEQMPIMTNSESLLQFGNNAYAKPATALSILRESVLGPELFDSAFKAYAHAWRFKRPEPSDLFRVMEDVSGVDLDWFWRGWFYSTLPVDIAISSVKRYRLSDKDPEVEKAEDREREARQPKTLAKQRDEGKRTRVARFPELKDFYSERDRFAVSAKDREGYEGALKKRKPWQEAIHERGGLYYDVTLKNIGGLVSFVPMLLVFESGAKELRRLPAELWRKQPEELKLLVHVDEPLAFIELDPYRETADIDRSNNRFPQEIDQGRFSVGSWRDHPRDNLMREELLAEVKAQKEALKKSKAEADKPSQAGAQNVPGTLAEPPTAGAQNVPGTLAEPQTAGAQNVPGTLAEPPTAGAHNVPGTLAEPQTEPQAGGAQNVPGTLAEPQTAGAHNVPGTLAEPQTEPQTAGAQNVPGTLAEPQTEPQAGGAQNVPGTSEDPSEEERP